MNPSHSPGPVLVAPLTPELFHPAFPLVREALPQLRLADWLRFARRVSAAGRKQEGIVVARRSGRPFPCGLCCWHVTRDVGPGRHLTAEHVVALDILDPAPVLDALLAELEGIAARQGCDALRSVVRPDCQGLPERLLAGGHVPAARVFQKGLAAPTAA